MLRIKLKENCGFKPRRKKKKYRFLCISCNKLFFSADVKTLRCITCRNKRKLCLCGCGNLVKSFVGEYLYGHRTKGKTYLDIYGTSNPNCGFKPGLENVAKLPEIRKKISKGVKDSYTPQLLEIRSKQAIKTMETYNPCHKNTAYKTLKGELVYSSLELEFANFLNANCIAYEIQQRIRLNNGHLKIVDFVVDGILIEISGFSYEGWRKDFLEKVKILRESVSNIIVLLTYSKFVEEMRKASDFDIFICAIEDKDRILRILKFSEQLLLLKKEFKNACNF